MASRIMLGSFFRLLGLLVVVRGAGLIDPSFLALLKARKSIDEVPTHRVSQRSKNAPQFLTDNLYVHRHVS